ncbi:SKIV2 Helicase, partial [Geococcyx californianus]|nr:SKIV2 Helicase [Geococcyx californianus]
PLLDAVGSLQLRDPEAVTAATRARTLAASLGTFHCVHSPRFAHQVPLLGGGEVGGKFWGTPFSLFQFTQFAQFAARRELQEELEQLQFQLSDQALELLPEYNQRLEVGGGAPQ